jgi:hypothetical protein
VRGVLLVVACLLVAAAWGANRSARRSPQRTVVRVRPAASTAAKAQVRTAAAQAPSATAWRYDAVVKRNLFKPLASGQPQKTAGLPALPPMPVDPFQLHDETPTGAAAAPAAPQPHWIYAGFVTVNGNPQAIVEKSDTKQAQFITVGQTLDGSVVKSISQQAIELARGSETTEMKISDVFTATPLNEPPKPTPTPGVNQGGQNRFGFPGGGFPGGGRGARFLQRMLQNNPGLANQASALLQGAAGSNQPQGGQQ